ncbi:ribonuclease III [bacterium]|jgi:ribonuclease-3|nr:ribonuclease III [bacterium]NBW57086.1 ribonuclease III [bacterium]NBX71440.1 ribonuclease III [bacterium]
MLTLEEKFSYIFKDKNLLKQALTHRSFGAQHNERLEFLGDAFLNAAMASWLYVKLSDQTEGVLTRSRAALVKKESLVKYATDLQLQDFLIVGTGELTRPTPAVLADAFEALCGALFLDAGFELAYKIFINRFDALLLSKLVQSMNKDPKTLLQELSQKHYLCLPIYVVLQQTGSNHQPTFSVKCSLASFETEGQGSSKKQAELMAAELMLNLLKERH